MEKRRRALNEPAFRIMGRVAGRYLRLFDGHALGCLSCVIPGCATAVECDPHATQLAAFKSHRAGGNRELHPLTGGGERTRSLVTAHGAIRSEVEGVGTPVGGMFPGRASVPLTHYFL